MAAPDPARVVAAPQRAQRGRLRIVHEHEVVALVPQLGGVLLGACEIGVALLAGQPLLGSLEGVVQRLGGVEEALVAATVVFGPQAYAWAATPTTVSVEMTDQQDGGQVMRLDRSEVPAGKVIFRVRNTSPDEVHEFLIVPTALTPDQFPMAKDGARVDEKKLKGIKELGDLKPGKDGAMTLNLKPGHYVVFCNRPGHFQGGMHAEFAAVG